MSNFPFNKSFTNDFIEKSRQKCFDDLIYKLKNIKNQLLTYNRNGLIDIDDKRWKEISNKLEELIEFIDELDRNKFKIFRK